jgi:two-component system cell cycle response regulator
MVRISPRAHRQLRLLMIHADDDGGRALIGSLADAGHRVKRASSLTDALLVLGSDKYDLLILGDTSLEGHRLDLLRRLGKELPAIPVILLAHGDEEQLALEVSTAGASGSLVECVDSSHMAFLPRLAEDLHRHAALERENRRLTRELRRRSAELQSANVRFLEHRQRLLNQERLSAVLEMTGATGRRLNQPLSVLLGSLELLQTRLGGNDDTLARLAQRIAASAHEIDAIIGRLVSLHRHRLQAHLGGDYIIDLDRDQWRLLIGVERREDVARISDCLGSGRGRFELIWTFSTDDALRWLTAGGIDAVLMSSQLPDLGGMDFLREAAHRNLAMPTILLTPESDVEIVGEALRQGAVDCLPWPLLSVELLTQSIHQALRLAQIEKSLATIEDQLRGQAALDPATGLSTPPRFHALLSEEFERARRHRRPLTVTVFEIDGWGQIAQALGGEGAADFLRRAGRALANHARQSDCLAHFADARFAAVLPETDAEGAARMTARIIEHLRRRMPGETHHDREFLTLSAGLSDTATSPAASDGDELLRRASEALGHAQAEGGGTVLTWHPPAPPAEAPVAESG